MTALELFLAEDEAAEMKRYTDVCTTVVETLGEIPGLRVVVEHDAVNRVIPHAVLYFTPEWEGPSGRARHSPTSTIAITGPPPCGP